VRRRRRRRIAVALIVLAAFLATRLPLLSSAGLWADEFFSLAMATGHSLEHPAAAADPGRGDFVEAPGAVAPREYARLLDHDSPPAPAARVVRAVELSDTSPPLYYLLLATWTRLLGTSQEALRLLSLVCALATLPLIARLARRAGGHGAVLPALTLFTLLPASVHYSTEGRMYALIWLEAAGSALLALESGRRRARPLALAGFVLVTSAGLLTHYAFAFIAAALLAALLLRPGALGRGRVALAALGIGLLALPWYLRLPALQDNWRVTAGWLSMVPDGFHRAIAFAQLAWSFFSLRGSVDVRLRYELAQLALFVALAAASAWRLRGRWLAPRRRMPWLWLLAALLPPLLLDALQGTFMVAVPRYALGGLPAAVVLAASGLSALRRRWRFTLLALLAAASLAGVLRLPQRHQRNSQPFRQLAEKLARTTGSDDLLIVHSIPSGVAGFARSLERAGAGPEGAPLLSWVEQLGGRRVPDDVARAAAGRRRVVHLSLHAVGAPPAAEEWLRRHARLVHSSANGTARLTIFEPSAGERF